MQTSIPLILLMLGVFAGIWLNRRDFGDLKSDINRQLDTINKRLDRVDQRLDRIDEDLRQFYGTDKALEGRINELSARIK